MNGEPFCVNLGDVAISVYDKVEYLAQNIDIYPIEPDDVDTIEKYKLAEDDLAMSFVESICNYGELEEDEEEDSEDE